MQTTVRNRMLFGVAAALIALLSGCGGGEPRGDVQGTVVFDGKPVPAGMVSFEPAAATGPARNVAIRDGAYRASGTLGLTPGTYRVRIAAGDAAAADEGPEADQHSPVYYRPLLPPSWNVQSELSVEVRAGRNTFNFVGTQGEAPRVETP
ncbi:MAG: hypothetical protein RBS80_02325 [Thermoguttaceae bacterium]|nr:hypothetical protein [Thermoguttaceae bacterium]